MITCEFVFVVVGGKKEPRVLVKYGSVTRVSKIEQIKSIWYDYDALHRSYCIANTPSHVVV